MDPHQESTRRRSTRLLLSIEQVDRSFIVTELTPFDLEFVPPSPPEKVGGGDELQGGTNFKNGERFSFGFPLKTTKRFG